jgi:hypothetical protein
MLRWLGLFLAALSLSMGSGCCHCRRERLVCAGHCCCYQEPPRRRIARRLANGCSKVVESDVASCVFFSAGVAGRVLGGH